VVGGRCAFSARNLSRALDPPLDIPIPKPIKAATGGKIKKEVGRCNEIAPSSVGEGVWSGCKGRVGVIRLDDASDMVLGGIG
jgi:hypothetical protein